MEDALLLTFLLPSRSAPSSMVMRSTLGTCPSGAVVSARCARSRTAARPSPSLPRPQPARQLPSAASAQAGGGGRRSWWGGCDEAAMKFPTLGDLASTQRTERWKLRWNGDRLFCFGHEMVQIRTVIRCKFYYSLFVFVCLYGQEPNRDMVQISSQLNFVAC